MNKGEQQHFLGFYHYKNKFSSLLIRKALFLTGGNKARASRILGLNRTSLIMLIHKLEKNKIYRCYPEKNESLESIVKNMQETIDDAMLFIEKGGSIPKARMKMNIYQVSENGNIVEVRS